MQLQGSLRSPRCTRRVSVGICHGIVDDPTWEALLTPEAMTALPAEPSVARCPLGTNRSRLEQTMPPDLVIAGRSSSPPQFQYAHFSPHSAAWRNYPFRDDQGQWPQLQLGDTDPQGSTDGPIRQLQAFLQDHGYYKGAIDGRFSQELHDVVVAYQNTHPSLLADGVINAADWQQLFRDDRLDALVDETVPNPRTTAAVGIAPKEDPFAQRSQPEIAIPPLPANVSLISLEAPEAVTAQGVPRHRPWLRLQAADNDNDPNGPIHQLQRLLFVVGLGVPLTGVFDMATERAVQQFQSQFPDCTDPLGEVGPDTWARLEQAAQQPLDPFSLLGAPAADGGSAALPAVADPRWYWDEALPLPATGSLEASTSATGEDLSNFPPMEIIDLSTPLPLTLPELQKGQTDATANGPIARLQQLLNEYGYVLTVDGQFNEATYQAVLNFQHSHDLPPTGVVDRPTWEVLMGGDTTDPDQSAVLGDPASGGIPSPFPAPTVADAGPTLPTTAEMPADLAIVDLSGPDWAIPAQPADAEIPADLAIVDLSGPDWVIPDQGSLDSVISDQVIAQVMSDFSDLSDLSDSSDRLALSADASAAAQNSPAPMAEVTPPAWEALMGPETRRFEPGPAQGADQGQEPLEPTPLLAATPPLDVSLPPELVELPIAPPDLGEEPIPFPPDDVSPSQSVSPGKSPLPDPLVPSTSPSTPVSTLVDVYAQGEAVLTASQHRALQWLSQQLPTATLIEFQQRWQQQGSGT